MTRTADYVVVGGGTAGAVVAARLSEDPNVNVLLLEAGGPGREFLIQLPAGMAKLLGNPRYDWSYPADSDPSRLNRTYSLPAGKVLGGSSSINGIVHMRGTAADYDSWERLGATGWNYASCLPFFKKSEQFRGEPSQDRGSHGPVTVSPMKMIPPLANTFLEACGELGMPTLPDYADGKMEGAFLALGTNRKGWRCSTEKAYLRPAARRSNLHVVTGVTIDTIILEGRQAVGVRGRIGTERHEYRCRAEVILCSGTFGSPGILMRSGIGNPDDLRQAGVAVSHALEEVGHNLCDHVGARITKRVNVPTYNSQTDPLSMVKHMLNFILGGKGALANPAMHAMALGRTRPDLTEPDVQFSYGGYAIDLDPNGGASIPTDPAVTINTNVCHPKMRGALRLSNDNPSGLRINMELLSDPHDLATLIDGCKMAERIFAADAWKDHVVGDRNPSPMPATDLEWEEYVRLNAMCFYHGVGTCRMGSDERAVVKPDLRVNGLGGLRVADASIMPALVSANTNAAAIMIGEKAADIIRRGAAAG